LEDGKDRGKTDFTMHHKGMGFFEVIHPIEMILKPIGRVYSIVI